MTEQQTESGDMSADLTLSDDVLKIAPKPNASAESDMLDLAAILHDTRTARSQSFGEVAEQTGLSKSVLHQIETGADARWSTALRVLAWAGYRVSPPEEEIE